MLGKTMLVLMALLHLFPLHVSDGNTGAGIRLNQNDKRASLRFVLETDGDPRSCSGFCTRRVLGHLGEGRGTAPGAGRLPVPSLLHLPRSADSSPGRIKILY